MITWHMERKARCQKGKQQIENNSIDSLDHFNRSASGFASSKLATSRLLCHAWHALELSWLDTRAI